MFVTKTTNRVISLLLSLVMIMSVLPMNVFAAAVSQKAKETAALANTKAAGVYYSPQYLPFVPLNIESATDSEYLKKYLASDMKSVHAMNYLFKGRKEVQNEDSKFLYYEPTTDLTKSISRNGAKDFAFKFTYELGSIEKSYINSNVVTVNGKTQNGIKWVAPFKVQNGHKKLSVNRHRYSGISTTQLAYKGSSSYGKAYYTSQSSKTNGTAYKGNILARFGYNHSVKLTGTNNANVFNNPDYRELKKDTTKLEITGYTFGGHEAPIDYYPMPFFMADLVAPRVTKITITDTNNKEKEYFGEGETMYFQVYFNEYIRTHNDEAAPLEKITLKFQIEGIANTVFEARCIGLVDNKLTFEWTVDNYDPNNKNTRAIPSKAIKSISTSNQNWATVHDDINQWYHSMVNGTRKSLKPDKDKFPKLHKTSLIVDLAGNSVDFGASVKTISNKNGVKVNNVAPTIKSIEIVTSKIGSTLLWEEKYPYISDHTMLKVYVNLSHPLYAKSGNKNWFNGPNDAELITNITNASGTPVRFSKEAYQEGSTVLEFVGLVDEYQSTGGEPIRIIEIEMPYGETIVDIYGNEFDATIPDAVIGEYTIDNTPPVIEVGELVRKAGSNTEFYIPFDIKDDISGVVYDGNMDITWHGIFTLSANTKYTDELPFTYRVSALPTVNEDDVFTNGSSLYNFYVQLEDNTHYLHVRLDEKTLTSLGEGFDTLTFKVSAQDNVQNVTEIEKTFDFVGDFGTTEFYQKESSFGPNDDDTGADGQMTVELYDPSGFALVEYAWLEDGKTPDENTQWYTDGITDITHDGSNWQGTFHITDLELAKTHALRLYLRVTDESGNEAIGGGYLLNIYVGDAEFKYETTSADTANTYHQLNVYYPETADKTITAVVSIDRNGDGIEDYSQELVYFYNPENTEEYINVFDDVIYDLYGKVMVTMTCQTTLGVSASATETFYFFSEDVGFSEAYDLAVTAIDSEGNEVNLSQNAEYTGPDGAPIVRNSLEGTALKIEISDNKIYNSFGLSDIIFEESFVTFYDVQTSEELAYEFLYEAHTNVINIPADLFEPGKYYGAEVIICTHGSSDVEYVYENIIFDNMGITLSGIESASRTAINPFTNEQIIFDEELSLGEESLPFVSFNVSGMVRDELDDAQYSKSVFTARTGYTTFEEINRDASNISNRVFMKIWNETLEETKEDAEWIELSLKDGSEYEFTNELYFVPQEVSFDSDNFIKVIDGTNILRYYFKTANGFETSEQVANVVAIATAPSLEIETSDLTNWSQSATFTNLGASGFTRGEEFTVYAGTDVTSMQTLVEEFITEGTVTVTENGNYWFGVSDDYHNITWYGFTFDMIDNTAPEISEFSNQDYAISEFYINITASDDKTLAEDLTVYVTVDEDFASDYGLGEDAVLFDYTGKIQQGIIHAEHDEKLGYSMVVPEDRPYYFTSALTGVYPYDMSRTDTEERTFTLHVIDAAGNEATATVGGTQQNLVPTLEEVGSEGGIFSVLFNTRVKILSPEYDYTALENYYSVREYSDFQMLPWIYKNGTYTITCVDAWGYEFTTDLVVDSFGDIYAIDVHFSEDGPTNEDVYVTVDATQNPYIYLDYTNIPEWQEVSDFEISDVVTDGDGNAKKVIYKADSNGFIYLTLMPYDPYNEDDEYIRAREIYVTNINKTPLELGVDYNTFASVDPETNTTGGNVKATVYSLDDRLLYSIEGDTSYTFTYGGPQSYIFKVRDSYGNTAEITATNPYIIANIVEENDQEAPDYAFDVFVTKFGVQEFYDSYLSSSEVTLPIFAENLTFVFHSIDQSTVSFTVENKGEGVDVIGNMVTVSGNSSFTMVLTDAAGNVTRVPINVDTHINTAPKGMVIYENKSDNGTVRAFINIAFSENEGRDVSVVGTMGLGYDEASGMYYRDFYSNGSYIFNLIDKLGITSAVTATVDNIDDSIPVGRIILSSPGIFDGSEWVEIDDSLTRQNVSMTISFTKGQSESAAYLRSIEAEILDGKGSLDDLIIQNYGNEAVVIFKENAKVRLTFSAVNGRVGTLELPEVNFINKTAPIVNIVDAVTEKIGEITNSITLSFVADRNVFFTNSGNYSEDSGAFRANTNHSYTIFANGEYEFRFVDTAGNTASVTYTAAAINSEPPVITLTDLNEGADYTNTDITAKVSIDMDGTIKHFGQEFAVKADEVISINFPYNGYYEIIATGANGLKSSRTVNIRMVDKNAPTIQIADNSVYAPEGTDYEELLLSGASAYDQISGDVTDTLTVTVNDGNSVQGTGTYPVRYTAVDKAGNVAQISAWLNIYGADAINVYVNGVYAAPGTLTVIKNTNEVAVTTNLGQEPYKMYYAKGIRTSAQMKYDGILFDGSLTLDSYTYYTVYIITQDRCEFIGRVLIES